MVSKFLFSRSHQDKFKTLLVLQKSYSIFKITLVLCKFLYTYKSISTEENSKMNLYDFAYCGDFSKKIDRLQSIAIQENWGKPTDKTNHPVLYNYIVHYFKKAHADKLIVFSKNEKDEKIACFNTGLLTPHYDDIYAYFVVNTSNSNHQEWFLADFLQSGSYKLACIEKLPSIAQFFSCIDDLYYDTSLELRLNAEHIVDDNYDRFPENLKQFDKTILINLIEGAIKIVTKRIQRNYKTAVPQYFNGQIQFLIPLCLTSTTKPDIAITIYKRENHYYGATCLTMDMAYNNARLLVKPEIDWLRLDN